MKRVLYAIFFALVMTSCNQKFTAEESATIHAGEREIMYVLSVTESPDSTILRQKSLPISEQMVQSEEFAQLCKRMLATVQNPENEGVGIAAPQVGILRRLVAVQRFDKEGEPFEFFVNPEILETGDEWAIGGEGCLSVPEVSGPVERAQSLVLRYRDVEFGEHTESIEGFTAVIFQHEIDHLNGELFIDKVLPEDELEEEDFDEEVE